METKHCKILIIVLLMIVLASCTSENVSVPASYEKCIDTFDNFAYTYPDADGPIQEMILPLAPWSIKASLPEVPEVPEYYSFGVSMIRSDDEHPEIWLEVSNTADVYRTPDAETYQFLVYRADQEKWQSVPAQVDNTGMFVDNLYVTSDGSIWGRNVWQRDEVLSDQPVLSRFSDEMGHFELQHETRGTNHGWVNPNAVSFPIWDQVLLDDNDIFWFFSFQDGIYSYDPVTQKLKQRAEITEFDNIHQVAKAPDGSIYFTAWGARDDGYLQDGQIFEFIPETGEIQAVAIPKEKWPVFRNILVNHKNHLWVDALGWQEPDGIWHKLIPMDQLEYWWQEVASTARDASPHIILESSDGRLWFRLYPQDGNNLKAGLAWFDPETQEGCWFTSWATNVVEGPNGQFWMVANGELYSYTR